MELSKPITFDYQLPTDAELVELHAWADHPTSITARRIVNTRLVEQQIEIAQLLVANPENPAILELAENAKALQSFLFVLEQLSAMPAEECKTIKEVIY